MRSTLCGYVTLASLGALLAFANGAAAAETPAPPAGPRLVVEQPSVDLGVLFKGVKVTHTFVLRNEGTEPLRLLGVEPVCHCTVAEVDEEIAPGATGKLTAVLDTLSLSGKGSSVLRLASNDPQSPTALSLGYDVQVRLTGKPGFARWASTQGEREGTIGNTIWATDEKDFDILAVESPHPYIRASFRPATEAERNPKIAGKQWRVELTLDAAAPVGPITGEALIRTDHPDQKLAPLPVSGFMRPTLFVFPERGEFGTLAADRLPLRATFKVTNFATEEIAVTGAESTIEGAELIVEPVEKGREYQVRIVLPAGMQTGPFQGTVAIRTDSAKAPVVEIPVSGVIEAPAATASASEE
jgi:hypothetical protein